MKDLSAKRKLWTRFIGGDYLTFQNDGNLVSYRNDGTKANFASNTDKRGAVCTLGNNGILYIFDSRNQIIWKSG